MWAKDIWVEALENLRMLNSSSACTSWATEVAQSSQLWANSSSLLEDDREDSAWQGRTLLLPFQASRPKTRIESQCNSARDLLGFQESD